MIYDGRPMCNTVSNCMLANTTLVLCPDPIRKNGKLTGITAYIAVSADSTVHIVPVRLENCYMMLVA